MKTIKGPAIFAQFVGEQAPFNCLEDIASWAAELGFKGIQIPSWESRLFDLRTAAEKPGYCDDLKGMLAERKIEITELSTHLQGQLVAVHPAYDQMFDGLPPRKCREIPQRDNWAVDQLLLAAKASQNLGLTAHAAFREPSPGHIFTPGRSDQPAWWSRFDELAKRWLPILNAFDDAGVDIGFEIHPGEDLHDGVTFEMFLERVNNHPRCNILFDPSHLILQQLDYLGSWMPTKTVSSSHISRMQNSIRLRNRVSMAAINPGLIVRAGSDLWAMDR